MRTAGRDDLEGKDFQEVRRIVEDAAPDLVINCAAHTDADAAELNPAIAAAANSALPGIIGKICFEVGAVLVQISSTGCYGAWKDTAYSEDDPLRPTTVHHKSKVAGEEAVRASGCEHLIVRTGWLFGGSTAAPRNFVWKRLIEASSGRRLLSDTSQHGCPTAVHDVARQVLVALAAGVRGTVNVVSQGSVSRFGYVERIVRAAQLPCEVLPSPAFARLAPVSPNEAAVNGRLRALGLDHMPRWEEAVDDYVGALMRSPDWKRLSGS
jgi:dTDP-4-dehydrorhamnose reductase